MMTEFVTRCPDEAATETRTIAVIDDGGLVPAGEYGFLELYCDEDGCDCRRAVITVIARDGMAIMATLSYGWASRAFYRRWSHDPRPGVAAEMKGVVLEPLGQQSRYAEAFRGLFEDMLRQDRAYRERIQRHYRLFKAWTPRASGPRKIRA
jgi:hypothetical protein